LVVVIATAASGQMLRFDGSSWVNEDTPYDVGMFIPGTHANGALMAQVVLSCAVSFADDFAGARAYAGVTATADTLRAAPFQLGLSHERYMAVQLGKLPRDAYQ
jgi:hypothetical protein